MSACPASRLTGGRAVTFRLCFVVPHGTVTSVPRPEAGWATAVKARGS